MLRRPALNLAGERPEGHLRSARVIDFFFPNPLARLWSDVAAPEDTNKQAEGHVSHFALLVNNANKDRTQDTDFYVKNPCGKKPRAPTGDLHYVMGVYRTQGIQ
jgi:hypothetical protein